MSTTLPDITITGQSVEEFVQRLSGEQKELLLSTLLQDAIRVTGGRGLIPMATPTGEAMGYYVPPAAAKARAERLLAEMPPEVRARMTAPIRDIPFSEYLTADQLIEQLKQEGVLQPQG